MQRLSLTKRCGKRRRREEWVTVNTVTDEIQAALLRVRLASAGVRCRIPVGSPIAAHGYGGRKRTGFAVQVPLSQQDRARHILADDSTDAMEPTPSWATYASRKMPIHLVSVSVLSTGFLVAFWMIIAAVTLAGLAYLCRFAAHSL